MPNAMVLHVEPRDMVMREMTRAGSEECSHEVFDANQKPFINRKPRTFQRSA
jgi:hypothetical protein